MEIRHRIGGDGSTFQGAPGSLGQNPLTYLNVIREGEVDNPEGEFRAQMYFIYMCNHFTNSIMKNRELLEFVNEMLRQEEKDWSMDPSFVEALNQRGPDCLPPIFRYGSQASLNTYLRKPISKEEKIKYLSENPNPALKEVMNAEIHELNRNFRNKLTNRELLNQFGVRTWREADAHQKLKYVSDASSFHLNDLHELPCEGADPRLDFAKKYIKIVKDLKIPTSAGISGTLDQSTAMASLVGLGIGVNREEELEQIKLAYLAFMIPNDDHSVHEIMQSTKSYGLAYLPGVGFEQYIYPLSKWRSRIPPVLRGGTKTKEGLSFLVIT